MANAGFVKHASEYVLRSKEQQIYMNIIKSRYPEKVQVSL
jgi:hypothetical protein